MGQDSNNANYKVCPHVAIECNHCFSDADREKFRLMSWWNSLTPFWRPLSGAFSSGASLERGTLETGLY